MRKKIPLIYALPAIIISVLAVVALVSAWIEPTADPPGGNVAAPINVGVGLQAKTGTLVLQQQQGGLPSLETYGTTTLAISSGNVGIGTTSPAEALELDSNKLIRLNTSDNKSLLIGRSADSEFFIRTGGTGGAALHLVNGALGKTWLYGKADGNVGIGTTSPGYKLDVNGDINLPATGFLRIAGGAGSSGQVLTRTATGMAWQVLTGTLPSGTSGQTLRHDGTSWAANNVIFNDGTNVGIRTTSPAITLAIGDTDTGLNWISDGNLAVYTNNAERIRITSAGNVGIGTTSPGEKLQVTGDIKVVSDSDVTTALGSGALYINNVAANQGIHIDTNEIQTVGVDLYLNNDNAVNTHINNLLHVTTGGNVGIGTTSPSAARLVVKNNDSSLSYAITGQSTIAPGSPGSDFSGVVGGTWDSNATGILGRAWMDSGSNIGKIGVFGYAASSTNNFAGFFQGKVRIIESGTGVDDGKLEVIGSGGILADNITVANVISNDGITLGGTKKTRWPGTYFSVQDQEFCGERGATGTKECPAGQMRTGCSATFDRDANSWGVYPSGGKACTGTISTGEGYACVHVYAYCSNIE